MILVSMVKVTRFGELKIILLILAALVVLSLPFAIAVGLEEGLFSGSVSSGVSGTLVTLAIGILFTAVSIFWEPVKTVVVAKVKGEHIEK